MLAKQLILVEVMVPRFLDRCLLSHLASYLADTQGRMGELVWYRRYIPTYDAPKKNCVLCRYVSKAGKEQERCVGEPFSRGKDSEAKIIIK